MFMHYIYMVYLIALNVAYFKLNAYKVLKDSLTVDDTII